MAELLRLDLTVHVESDFRACAPSVPASATGSVTPTSIPPVRDPAEDLAARGRRHGPDGSTLPTAHWADRSSGNKSVRRRRTEARESTEVALDMHGQVQAEQLA